MARQSINSSASESSTSSSNSNFSLLKTLKIIFSPSNKSESTSEKKKRKRKDSLEPLPQPIYNKNRRVSIPNFQHFSFGIKENTPQLGNRRMSKISRAEGANILSQQMEADRELERRRKS